VGLSDAQWVRIEPSLPDRSPRRGRRLWDGTPDLRRWRAGSQRLVAEVGFVLRSTIAHPVSTPRVRLLTPRAIAEADTRLGGLVSDLALNSQALSGFANTLHRLVGDFEQPVYFSPVCSDVLNDDLSMLAGTDKTCGDGLHSYLTTLASLADAAAKAAEQLDQQLAKEARGHHGRVFAE
jgi:hypothetical protein